MEIQRLSADQLMVGDWIYNNDSETIEKVNCILYEVIHTNCFDDVSLDDVSPIRITSEILEKNGFERRKEKKDEYREIEYFTWSDSNFCKIHFINGFGWFVYVKNFTEGKEFRGFCNAVHELQHALKICEIEKEIKL